MFSSVQVEALRTLLRLWSADRFVLIGASALGCWTDMRWRQTRDLDLALAATVEEYPAGLDREPGWSRDSRQEQRWRGPGDVLVDIIPVQRDGQSEILRWPVSGFEMSLAGLGLAFEKAVPVEIAQGLTVRVAPVHVIAFLKMVAFLDRPQERGRDLADVAHILDEYISDVDERRYSDEIVDLGLTYDEVSPFLLGKDLGRILNEKEKHLFTRFTEALIRTSGSTASQAQMLAVAPDAWHRDPDELLLRINALRRGAGISTQGS